MPEYQHLTDDEILHLAEEREQLTQEAQLALDGELNRRRISPSDIDSYTLERVELESAEKLKRSVSPYIAHVGLGKKFYGKTNRRRDPSGLFELYDSTLWFVALWFPVFPIATYTVRRNFEKWLGFEFASVPIAVKRHLRNWEQIFLTRIKAMLTLWAVILLLRHREWLEYVLKRVT